MNNYLLHLSIILCLCCLINTLISCLFMLNTTCDFNNALVNAEINITSTALLILVIVNS